MNLYDRNLMVNILEAKLLETFDDYYPQNYYNNRMINYLYRYIRLNTYTGEHDNLLRQFVDLKLSDEDFKNVKIKENTDRKTYTLTCDNGFTSAMQDTINLIMKEYYNYDYTVLSEDRIEVRVNFGWLPQTAVSTLNLINDECLIDYYIDGITLRPNTYGKQTSTHDYLHDSGFTHNFLSQYSHRYITSGGTTVPNSGYVCYLIDSIKAFDTVMFFADLAAMGLDSDDIEKPKFKVATLLTELRGSKGGTLNRIVEFDLDNFFYELGPYVRSYLTTEKSALVIQVPYEYASDEYFYLFDVSTSVKIAHNNNFDENHQDNYFVAFSNPNFDSMFTKYKLKNRDVLVDGIINNYHKFSDVFVQYILGNFIWRTSDSKLIAYSQNLMNALFANSDLVANGVWSDALSTLVVRYKKNSDDIITLFDDDVIDINTEIKMIHDYKNMFLDLDPNEQLFNEW